MKGCLQSNNQLSWVFLFFINTPLLLSCHPIGQWKDLLFYSFSCVLFRCRLKSFFFFFLRGDKVQSSSAASLPSLPTSPECGLQAASPLILLLFCVDTPLSSFSLCAPVGFSLGHEQSSLLCLISLFILLSLSHDSLLISMEVKASISFSVFWWWLSLSFKYPSRSLIFKYDFSLEMIKNDCHARPTSFFCFFFFPPRPDSSSPSDLLVRPRVSTEFERNGRLEGSR